MSSLSWFSLNGAMYLLPFFLLGMCVRSYWAQMFRRELVLIYILASLLLLILYLSTWDGRVLARTVKYSDPIVLMFGVFGLLLLYRFKFSTFVFSTIGFYAFSIYLYHRFAFDFVTIGFHFMGLPKPNVSLYIAAGITFPILAHRLVGSGSALGRVLGFGK